MLRLIVLQPKKNELAFQRFVEESQITSQLAHPNIVSIHELGKEQSGHLYLAMKLNSRDLAIVKKSNRLRLTSNLSKP